MTITITKNIQAHINFLKNLPNITDVKVESVPSSWKEQIGNIDSIMFVIYKNNLSMDLVLPLETANLPMDPYTLSNVDRLAILINGLIDKSSSVDCIMCSNTEFFESFYYMNPKNNMIEEIENVHVKTQLSFEEKNLTAYLLTLPFVKEVFFYTIVNNPNHMLIACNIVNLGEAGKEVCPLGYEYCAPHGARYKVLVPIEVLIDISLQKTIIDSLVNYYDTTVSTVESGVYDKKTVPVLPNHLKAYIQ
jgi:hypothetical protein